MQLAQCLTQLAQCLTQLAVSDAASTVSDAASTVSDAASTVSSVCFERRDNQPPDNEIMIGFTTKQLHHTLRDEVEHVQISKLYSAA